MSLTVYGIKNCNTVKSALAWLKENDIAFTFHDFKSRGVDDDTLKRWSAQTGWENLINRKGTTWRQLPDDVRSNLNNQAAAIALMKEKTSVIKRPVIESDGTIVALGFDEKSFAAKLL